MKLAYSNFYHVFWFFKSFRNRLVPFSISEQGTLFINDETLIYRIYQITLTTYEKKYQDSKELTWWVSLFLNFSYVAWQIAAWTVAAPALCSSKMFFIAQQNMTEDLFVWFQKLKNFLMTQSFCLHTWQQQQQQRVGGYSTASWYSGVVLLFLYI